MEKYPEKEITITDFAEKIGLKGDLPKDQFRALLKSYKDKGVKFMFKKKAEKGYFSIHDLKENDNIEYNGIFILDKEGNNKKFIAQDMIYDFQLTKKGAGDFIFKIHDQDTINRTNDNLIEVNQDLSTRVKNIFSVGQCAI